MAEEFVLLESAPTGAHAPMKLPERFARAAPNPLPLFPRGAATRGGRVAFVVWAVLVALSVVSSLAAKVWHERTVPVTPTRDEPGPPPFDRPFVEPPPVPEPVSFPETIDLVDGRYPDLRAERQTYRIAAAGGETITIAVEFSTDEGDLDLELYDAEGSQCGRYDGADGVESITWRVEREQVLSLIVQNPSHAVHDLSISRGVNGLGPGLARGLRVSRGGVSYPFEPIHAEQVLMVTVRFAHDAGDVDARILDQDGAVCGTSTGISTVERMLVRDARRCRELFLFGADTSADVEVEFVDWLDAATGWALAAPCARRVYVPAGQVLRTSARFSHAQGDVDLELLDMSGTLLASSTSGADHEELRWVAPADGEVVIRLYHATPPPTVTSRVALDIELGP